MTPERWRQVDQLLQDTLERGPAERVAFLAEACGGDEELRQEVESLLSFHERAENFIEEPPADVAADWRVVKESRAGQTLGHYYLIRQIGRGGMGDVYLARDTRLDRHVALKLLPTRLTEDVQSVQRFRQEARAVSALNHPNIITIHEIGEVGGVHFIATEFVEGETLRKLIATGGMKPSESLEVAIQVAGALSAAHAAGITHRDIKPENIMLRPDGYVKVLDFGLAKLSERPAGAALARFNAVETDPGVVSGTISYMSPEQARGLDTDSRSDIFSLGVVLYEMITSRRPFAGETAADVVASLLGQEPAPIAEHSADAPAGLQAIVSRMLAKDCDQRYQTADEMRRALKRLQREVTPDDDYSTRQYSGLSLLARRFGGVGESEDHKTTAAGNTTHGRVTSSISLLITRFMRSPRPVVLTLLTLGVLIAGVALLRPRLTGSAVRVDSIAVLPFKPLVTDSREEALEMGLADTLITRLSNLKSVTVRPIGAVRRYTALDQDPVAAGRELQVQAVLEGSIQKVGDKIRVTARLVRVADGKLIWTRQFDEHWTDIFAVQDTISQRAASDLVAPLTGEERSELARNYTNDPAAYKLYLEGRYHWNKRTGEGMRKSIEYFRQAIELDNQYALAYVGMADAYATLGSYRIAQPKEVGPLARDAAERALNIDKRLPEAHASMGKILTDYDWDWTQAEKEFRLAIELKPNYAYAHHWYSTLLAHLGRYDEAVYEVNRALELDFLSPATTTQVGQVLYRARRYDEAMAILRKTLELEPGFVAARYYLGLCYVMQRKYDEANAEFQKAREVVPNSPDFIAIIGYTYAISGKRQEALRYQADLNELANHTFVLPYSQLLIPSALGEMDEVFRLLDKCFEERDPAIRGLKSDPLFDRVRSDPRFAVLLRRAGLAP
jgi:eukaryotic-like serine/threonine-protein kinase